MKVLKHLGRRREVCGGGHVGGRFGLLFTRTYIKSESGGYWCDPYWGGYLVGDAKYSNQFEFNGGITFRF